jgi:hypothetical protein
MSYLTFVNPKFRRSNVIFAIRGRIEFSYFRANKDKIHLHLSKLPLSY